MKLGMIEFPLNVEECMKALVENGTFGNTVQEVVKYFVQHSLFRLDDVKPVVIYALLKQGKSEGWVVRNVPGSRRKNATALKHVKEDKDAYPLEESEP